MAPRASGRTALVTFASDLGAAYAAQVRAVLARALGPGRLVDLTHDLPAHGVAEGAFLLRAIAGGFPPGTIHLAVVDPGVGGTRRPIVLACRDGSRIVGPDNGLLFPLALALGTPRGFCIDPGRLGAGPRVGTTFDARDLFAPAVVRLARGARPSSLGPPIRPREYRIPAPVRRNGWAVGEILHVDRFGNLISNVPSDWVPPATRRIEVRFGRRSPRLPWGTSYEELGKGRIGALASSFGTLEVAVGQGSARRRWGGRVGARIRVRPLRASGVLSIGK